jgi:4-methoxybenzoate monooxygenase (O-demethylating)
MALTGPAPYVSDYDPFTPEAILDAHRHDGAIRELAPAVYLSRYDIWAVARWQQVHDVLRDSETFSSTSRPFFDPKAIRPNILITQDPPEHTRVREVIMRVLTPGALKELRESFAAAAERLVERVLAPGRAVELDGHTELAAEFVLEVFPDALGLPEEGRRHMLRFGDAAFNAFGPRNEIYQRGMARAADAIAWVDENTKREALHPGGLGEAMHRAADRGEVTAEEAELLVRTLFAAGFDTTVYGLGSLLRAFAEFPDQWQLVREDPSLVRNAFEEGLRLEPPSRFGGRVAVRDTEIGGVPVPAGARFLVMWLASGRDPRRWEDPDRFDVRRKVTGHQSFGYGIHVCVGMVIARMEAEALFTALARRVERIELAGEPERAVNFQAHGHDRIPLRLVAG